MLTEKFDRAAGMINKSENILITTHARPDGDACGSAAALQEFLLAKGKNCKILFLSEVPGWYEFMFREKYLVINNDIKINDIEHGRGFSADLFIIVDTNSRNQLQGFTGLLNKTDVPAIVFDHHVTSDHLGDFEVLDTSASATGVIVKEFLDHSGWELTKQAAEALFCAVSTDTGWFRFSNSDSRTFRCCADLLDKEIDINAIYRRMYQNFTIDRFDLMKEMLSTVEFHYDGKYVSQYITNDMFTRTGARYSDTESMIDECQKVRSVKVAALFTEQKDGSVKCSLRSRGGINVGEIAQYFGGGGHTQAAGTKLKGPLSQAMKMVKEKIEQALE